MENNFARNLKHLRVQKGLTQEELGKILHKDYSTIGKWELGQRSPIMEDVIKIAEFFDISLHDLIGGNISVTGIDSCASFDIPKTNEEYKKILKEKGLMDDKGYIKEDKLKNMLELAEQVRGLVNNDKNSNGV